MRRKLELMVTLTLLLAVICSASQAAEKTLEVPNAPVPSTEVVEGRPLPQKGLQSATKVAQVVVVSDRGAFGLALKVGDTAGAVFEIQAVGIDSKAKYRGIDSNDFLHYEIVGTNVEMAIYNYSPFQIFMKVGSGAFNPWVDSSRPYSALK